MRQRFQDELLDHHLKTYLPNVEPEALNVMRERLEWVEVSGGQTLMTQGEVGDAMYLVLSGRLRAYVSDEDGLPRSAREMGRGQIIGEMSLITGQPRGATVVAIRDSMLVRLGKSAFDGLLATSPQLAMVITRQIVEHLQAAPERGRASRAVTIGMIPVSSGVDVRAFAEGLAAQLAALGRVRVLAATDVDMDLETSGIADGDIADAGASRGASRSRSTRSKRAMTSCCCLPTTPRGRGRDVACATATRYCCWPTRLANRGCIQSKPLASPGARLAAKRRKSCSCCIHRKHRCRAVRRRGWRAGHCRVTCTCGAGMRATWRGWHA